MVTNRINWIDYAKGISIILVVLHHAIPREVGMVFYNSALLYLNDMLKFFRMPLFFFVSGLFLYKALKKDALTFYKNKVLNFLYLFVLWGFIQYFIQVVAPYLLLGVERTPEQFKSILFHFIEPRNFWFIYALLLFFLVSRLTKRIPVITFGFSIILFIISVQNGNHHDPSFMDEISRYYPMFLLGYFISDLIKHLADKVKWYHTLLTIPFFLITDYVLHSSLATSPPVVFMLMCVGIVSGVVYSVLLSRIPYFSWVNYIGKNTLPIYVMHWFPVLIFNKILAIIIPTHTYLAIFILVITGVTLPLLVYSLSIKINMGWLFKLPTHKVIVTKPKSVQKN